MPAAPPADNAVAQAGAGFTIETSGNIGDFADIWPNMAELQGSANVRSHAFQCRDHLQVWLDTIGAAAGYTPFFVCVRTKAGAPLMLLPLGVRKHRGLRILSFLDAGVCDYNAPVVFEAAANLEPAEIRAMWDAIRRAAPRHDIAALEKCPQFVGDFKNPLHILAPEPWPQSGHCLALGPDTWNGALEKKRDLRESHRKRKRIAEIGELQFSIAREDAEIDRVYDAFLRQKSRRYMETLGVPGFDVPGQRRYYHALTRQLSERGAQLAYLSVGNEIIATGWSLISGRRLYYLMCAYEAGDWSKYSPGRLLMEDLVKWAYAHGCEFFDLGIGDEAYKFKWKQSDIPLVGALYPRSPSGHLYAAALKLRALVKESLPPSVLSALKSVVRKRP